MSVALDGGLVGFFMEHAEYEFAVKLALDIVAIKDIKGRCHLLAVLTFVREATITFDLNVTNLS